MRSKLTIVTTTYNQEKYIAKALDSFISQKTDFPFEVLISDDCSTDSTAKIIEKYAKKYPDIIKPIYHKKNIGFMDNFIDTLDRVRTEYVAFCDGDDYWCDDNKLQLQVDFLEKNKDYNICFHQARIFFEKNERPDENMPSKSFPENTSFDDLLKQNYIPANTIVYRWVFGDKFRVKDNFPDNIVPGDYYIHLVHAKNGKIHFINQVMSCYRRHIGGTWWLSCQEDRQDEFTLKYGIQYYNFFKSLEKNLNLDEKIFESQKYYLANNIVRVFMLNKKIDELINIRDNNKLIFDECIKNSQSIAPVYENLPKFKKFFYLLIIEPSLLKNKIFRKLEKYKLFSLFFRVKRYVIRKIKREKVDNVNKTK